MTRTNLVALKELAKNRPYRFDLDLSDQTADMARLLGIPAVAKPRFQGELRPRGKADWHLDGKIGATATMSCVVTGDPVQVRIDDVVSRTYTKALSNIEYDVGETEMPEDDTVEALPDVLDLNAVFTEALSLALPDYVRKDGATLEQSVFTAPGIDPLTDEKMNPFSGLAALKDKLGSAKDQD